MKRLLIATTIVLSIFGLIIGVMSASKVNNLLATNISSINCLQHALKGAPANGVAEYWIARTLDVYGRSDERVLQVNSNLTVYPGLNNIASYENKTFSFVLVEKPDVSTIPLTANNVIPILGYPTSIYSCKNYDVYLYSRGSTGEIRLNKIIRISDNSLLQRYM
jgi:hypothetical protein